MKIKYCVVLFGSFFLFNSVVFSDPGDKAMSKPTKQVEKVIKGTELALLELNGELELYGSPDGEAVSKHGRLLFTKLKNGENETELSFFKNGFCFSFETLDANEVVVNRTYSILDDKGVVLFSYIDLDGDGLFDKLIDYNKRKTVLLKIDPKTVEK